MSVRAFLLVLACAVALAAAGCTKISTQTGVSHAGNPWTIHGVLRAADVSEPDNLNPMIGNQQAEVDLAMFWGAWLFRWSDQNEWVPELALEVPTLENGGISQDGLQITYHLRKGVTWHDDAPFGADDVIYSWQQVMNPRNNVGSRAGYDDIAGIDKKDDATIVVHLRKPYAPFIAAFFSQSGTPICIIPKHVLSRYADINRAPYNLKPIGTGPFVVDTYDKGVMIKFKANPAYFRGPPKLKEIDWHFIPDSNTIVTQLRTHELDAWMLAISEYLPTLRSIPGITVYRTPFTSYTFLGLNLKTPSLRDKVVRQALAYAVDNDTIINKVYHGNPLPAYSDQPEFLWAHNPNVKRYPYDPKRASAMLEADGWKLASDGFRYKNGQRLQIQIATTPGGSGAPQLVLQQGWQRIGVDASVKIYAIPIYFATYGEGGILQTGKFDVSFSAWVNGVDPDDATNWMCDQFPPGGQNIEYFCDPRLDAQERIALTSYDPKVRQAAYHKIQDILADQEPAIYLYYTRRLSAVNTDLKGYKPAHAVSTMWNPWEWEI
jgi:peptide/nickel transport system substrate-binding protein